jgi:gliding motility-associated-like protein
MNFTISFQFINEGDIGLSGNVPITFYNGNPMAAGAIKLNTITVALADLGIDEIQTVTNATVNGPGGPFTLYIVLNDDGSTVPTPISLPNTDFLECDYTNNILSSPVNPNPVPITAVLVNNNNKCVGSTSPNNGAIRAFIPVGAVENTADYNFYWSIGTTPKAIPADYQGATVNGLPEGTYTVYARHKTANCNSATAQVTIARISPTIDVDIELVHAYDNCQNPNGQLKAIVNDTDGNGTGDPVGNFTYVWYEGNDIFTDPQVSVSHVATGLKPLTYTVVVTDKATGCQSINSFTVPDESVQPVVATNVVNISCSTASTGSVSANVNGATAGFTFRWYHGSVVNPAPNFTGAIYNNRPAGNYTVVAMNNTSKCLSDPVTVTITQTTSITVAVSGVNHMTSCDPGQPNGSASASVGGVTTGFNFQWFRGQNTLAGNLVSSTATATGLTADIYTVKATNIVSGCTDTEEVTINFNVVTPSLILGSVGDLTDCRTPNGTITVNVSLDTPSDYTFRWFDGPSVKTTPDYADTDNVLSGLSVGQYTVQAIHNTKHCATAPISATVDDNTPTIQIIQNSSVRKLPTDCNSNDGLLEVSVSAAGNTTGFNMEWFRNSSTTPFATFSNVTTSRVDTLSSALYTIRATNLDNGCSAEQSFELPFATAQDLDLVSKADATTCSPQNEGNIVLRLTPTPASIPGPPPISFTVDDYIINFYSGSGTSGTLVQTIPGASGIPNGDGTSNYTISGLTPGFYTAVAVESNPLLGGCASIPVIVEILLDVNFPQVIATANNANTNCTGAMSTGNIVLDIDGVSAENNYAYAWFEGTTTASPALGTATTGNTTNFGATAQNLPGGLYTVRVTNNTTLCETITTFQIFNNPPAISIAAADVTLTAIVNCTAPTAGSALVSTIRENGVAVGLANYSFTWLDANQNVLPNAVTPNTTNAINNLAAGNYSVLVTKTGGASGVNCASTQMSFTIEDQTIGTVDVFLNSFTQPTRCLQPANRLGEMIAEGTGTSTTGYTYNWYTGGTTSGTLVSNASAISDISITLGELDTTLTVEVINNSNQCRIAATYVLPLEIVPVTMTSSAASPMTSCLSADGTVFATVTSGNSNAYSYEWSIGSTVQTPPAFTGKQINGLSVNNYTIIATDLADNFCQSEPQIVSIVDGRMFPVVTATQIAPVTICDPARPDGVAAASVGGDVVNYFFDWYSTVPPTGTAIHRGSQFGNLTASTFSVIATHLVTGCSDTTQITIQTNIAAIPAPLVQVLSDVTSCLVDNGALQASVNGNTGDYIFHWYNVNPGSPVDTTSADFIGEIYTDLAVGTYYVSATSRLTGCISGPANGPIIADPNYPDFDFKITPSSCDENNGSISLFMLNDVDIESITWSFTGSDNAGPLLDGIPAGIYSVTVTTTMGCSETREVEVKTEIRPYNGVSRNIDGKNDFFHINCIENFPDNIVKIFNRAGTLVFEAQGYDNVSTYFDGKSNKGIAVMGNNLPDGTYFYIIDKRDGTKPLAGYLEVVK